MNDWSAGFKNTKTFRVDFGLIKFLQGCRHCNKPTSYTNAFRERQLLGNCYQSLCNCSTCNKPIVLDEYCLSNLDRYLTHKKINKNEEHEKA